MIRNVVKQRIDSYDHLEQQLFEAIQREAAVTAAVQEKLQEEVTSATNIPQGKSGENHIAGLLVRIFLQIIMNNLEWIAIFLVCIICSKILIVVYLGDSTNVDVEENAKVAAEETPIQDEVQEEYTPEQIETKPEMSEEHEVTDQTDEQ